MKKYSPYIKFALGFLAVYLVTLGIAYFVEKQRYSEVTTAEFTKIQIGREVVSYELLSDRQHIAIISITQESKHLSTYDVTNSVHDEIMQLDENMKHDLLPSTHNGAFFLVEREFDKSIYAPNSISEVTIEGKVDSYEFGDFDCDLQKQYQQQSKFIDFQRFKGDDEAPNFILIPTPDRNILTGSFYCPQLRFLDYEPALWQENDKIIRLYSFPSPSADISNSDFAFDMKDGSYSVEFTRGDCEGCEETKIKKGGELLTAKNATAVVLPNNKTLHLNNGKLVIQVNTDLYIW